MQKTLKYFLTLFFSSVLSDLLILNSFGSGSKIAAISLKLQLRNLKGLQAQEETMGHYCHDRNTT